MPDEELLWRASFTPGLQRYLFRRVWKVPFMFLTRGQVPLWGHLTTASTSTRYRPTSPSNPSSPDAKSPVLYENVCSLHKKALHGPDKSRIDTMREIEYTAYRENEGGWVFADSDSSLIDCYLLPTKNSYTQVSTRKFYCTSDLYI